MPIFIQGGNVDPWMLQLGDSSNWGGVAVDLSDPSNVTSLANISAGPRVDSPTFQFGGITVSWLDGPAQVYSRLPGVSGANLSSYLITLNGALVFNIRSAAPPSSSVTTRIDCVFPCIGELDLTPAYTAASDGQWHELAVPLICFAGTGTDFTNIDTPFLVFTDGAWQADFAAIRFEPNYIANVTCDGQYIP